MIRIFASFRLFAVVIHERVTVHCRHCEVLIGVARTDILYVAYSIHTANFQFAIS